MCLFNRKLFAGKAGITLSLEWFDRVSGELQEYLESICEEYDEIGHITIDRASKHPKMDFYVEVDEEEREYFCTLYFDPHNEEFYLQEYDIETEHTSKVILPDIEDIIDAVHEAFHDYLDDEGYEVMELEEDEDDDFLDEYDGDMMSDDEDYEEIVVDVDWTTPEVLAYQYMDEVEVSYQFGVVQETGDGVLRRINKIVTDDEGVIEDETNFIFSKEEAGTIIELIEKNMDAMDGFDHS